MEAIRTPKVKICCTQSIAEAHLAIKAGADWLGFVSSMPSGPGILPDERIVEIATSLPDTISTVLLTARQDAQSIIGQQNRTGVKALQCVDSVPTKELRILRSALPRVWLIQVIHVLGEGALNEALQVAPYVDALLLDSGNPGLEVKELGGTGRIHDWSVSRKIRAAVKVPVILAGGLNPGNVRSAILSVGPYGLDVCTGVRTDGRLDPAKLRTFFQAARSVGSSPS
jgi:phosphoribosylanthranilate isomerase